jgi:hypothetical protein
MFTELGTKYGDRYFLYEGYYRSRPYDVSSISVFMRKLIEAGMPETSMERRKDAYMGFQVLVIKQSAEVDAIFARLVQERRDRIQQENARYAETVRAWEENAAQHTLSDIGDLP